MVLELSVASPMTHMWRGNKRINPERPPPPLLRPVLSGAICAFRINSGAARACGKRCGCRDIPPAKQC